MTKKKLILVWSGVIVLLLLSPFLILFGYTAFLSIKEHVNRIAFASETWKNVNVQNCHSRDAKRIRMVDDLLAKHDLKGMSKAEVETLLGEGDRTGYFKDYDMVYCLGPERGFLPLDSEWLVIKLNQNRVQEYRLARD